jgi:FMN phosphatase YigB (HAD superfamily)
MKQLKNSLKSAILACMITVSLEAANIVFDLGDVLIETKYLQSALSIGPKNMISYAATLNNPFGIDKKLFSYLDSIKPLDPEQIPVKDHYGNILPQLMADWLKGFISDTQLTEIIDQNPGTFSNYYEEQLVHALAHTIFNPAAFVKTRALIVEGLSFVNERKAAGDNVYILSNWDSASFELLKRICPDIFSMFDGIMISGKVGLAKPDTRIYQKFLETFNLDPADTVFIDDQIDNIRAAEMVGIHGILYTKRPGLLFNYHNFDNVRRQLQSWLQSKDFMIPIDDEWYQRSDNQ